MTTTNNTNTIPATETIMDTIAKIKADKITLTPTPNIDQAFSATCTITIPDTATEIEKDAYNKAVMAAAKAKVDKHHADTYHGHESYIAAVKNHAYSISAAGKTVPCYIVPLLPLLADEQRTEYKSIITMLQRLTSASKNITAATKQEEEAAHQKCESMIKTTLQRAFTLIQGIAPDNLHVNGRDARLFDSVRPSGNKITTLGDTATASMIELVCCEKISGNPYLVSVYSSDKKWNDTAESGAGLDILPAKKA